MQHAEQMCKYLTINIYIWILTVTKKNYFICHKTLFYVAKKRFRYSVLLSVYVCCLIDSFSGTLKVKVDNKILSIVNPKYPAQTAGWIKMKLKQYGRFSFL